LTLPSRAQVTRLVSRLVTELTEADTDTFGALISRPPEQAPQAFARLPWVSERVTRAQAAELIGYTSATLAAHAQRGRKAREENRESATDMPAPAADGTWSAGELALWVAIRRSRLAKGPRWPSHAMHEEQARVAANEGLSARQLAQRLGVSGEKARILLREAGAPGRPPDSALIPLVRAYLATSPGGHPSLRPGPRPRRARATDVMAMLKKHGYGIARPRAVRLITTCGGTAITPAGADTEQGHVRAATLARAAGCSPQRITAAVAEQRLTPASTDRWGPAYDLKWVKPGKGHLKAPTDSWWQPIVTGPDGKVLPPDGCVLPPAWGFAAAVGWLRRDLAEASAGEREGWLAATPDGTPPTFGRHGWMHIPLAIGEVAALAHSTETAVMRSETFPDPSGEDGDGEPTWTAGQVALWMASLRSSP